MEQRMIGYTKGITRSSGDLMVEDGELMECINLKCENGELKPLLWPKKSFEMNEDEVLKYIHKGSGYENYLYVNNGNLKAFYFDGKQRKEYNLEVALSGVFDIDSVGHTLIVSDSNGLHYILYKNESYKYLGQRPPLLKLRFGLRGPTTESNEYTLFREWPITHENTINSSEFTDYDEYSQVYDEYVDGLTNSILGAINKWLEEYVTGENMFAYPFLVRYAYKMYDGSNYMQSIPLLMTPSTTINPYIKASSADNYDGSNLYGFRARLYCYAENDISESLSDWSDIIRGVDIAVSEEVRTYDQTGKVKYYVSAAKGNAQDGNTSELNNYVGYAIKSTFLGRPNGCDDSSKVSPSTSHSISRDAWRKVTMKEYLEYCGDDYNTGGGTWVIPYKTDAEIKKAINDLSLFYKIATLPIDGIPTSLTEVDMLPKTLSTLVTRERMDDDNNSHFLFKSNGLYTYNSRLHMYGVEKKEYSDFSVSDFVAYNDYSDNNNKTLYGVVKMDDYNMALSDFSVNPYYFSGYYYYPNIKATNLTLYAGTDKYVDVNLSQHKGLNGSVYFDVFFPFDDIYNGQYTAPSTSTPWISEMGKIYTSEVNNPFVFKSSGVNTVGTGEVLGIVSVTKALSQGQFGQFPLLALCTDGIWALTVNDEGLYSTKQMVSREVCNNADSVVQTDNAVYFSSEKGLMVIDGSEVRCVTPQMEGLVATVSGMKRMEDLLKSVTDIHEIVKASDSDKEFVDYLRGSIIGYSYRDQALYICEKSSQHPYIYVFNIKNNTVSKLCNTEEEVVGFINKYPDTLMLGGKGKTKTEGSENVSYTQVYSLLDAHELEGDAVYGFAMTRPMKLGDPTGMKRIKQVKNIKNVHDKNSYVKYALWGSNDGMRWYYVGSYDGGFKYYRIGLFTKLRSNESLLGTVMLTDKKRNNKLR